MAPHATTAADAGLETVRPHVDQDITGARIEDSDVTSTGDEVGVTFMTAALGAHAGYLVGEFNDWSTDATPMALVGDLFQVTIPLRPGQSYRYKFLLDGERWENDLHADDYALNEVGGYDSVRNL
ncbi:MAG: isoamylase early set domain-containing protein [Acidimicrobiia bacterium]